MLYANYAREKLHNLILIKEARGYPCVFLKSKGKNLKDYKIYGNSIQNGTPTPDNPIEIESVGEKTKNLLNPKAQLTTLIGVYKGIDVIEYAKQNVMLSIRLKEGKSVPSGIYFGVPYKLTTSGAIGYWLIDNGVLKNTRFNLKQLGDTVTDMGIGVYPATQTNWDKIFDAFDVQLELGTIATDYEPYGYKIPVKVSGKNLFNKETATLGKNINATTGTLYNSSKRCVSDYIEVDVSKQYTFVYNPIFTASRYLACYDKDKNYLGENKTAYNIVSGNGLTAMTISFLLSEVKYIRANCFWNEDGTQSEIDDFIIYEGSGDNTYEPYVEPKTTNIYLKEPLRKIGDYADYIDFKNQKVIRNIVENEILNAGGIYRSSTFGVRYSLNVVDQNNAIKKIPGKPNSGMLCNLLINIKNKWSADFESIMFHSGNDRSIYFCFSKERLGITEEDDNATMIEKCNTYIQNLNNNGIKFMVYYEMETPTEETIELSNIPTHKGTTIIGTNTNISPSDIWVKYISK